MTIPSESVLVYSSYRWQTLPSLCWDRFSVKHRLKYVLLINIFSMFQNIQIVLMSKLEWYKYLHDNFLVRGGESETEMGNNTCVYDCHPSAWLRVRTHCQRYSVSLPVGGCAERYSWTVRLDLWCVWWHGYCYSDLTCYIWHVTKRREIFVAKRWENKTTKQWVSALLFFAVTSRRWTSQTLTDGSLFQY